MRQVAKQMMELIRSANRGIEMDNMMDGSGECGAIIAKSYMRHVNASVRRIVEEHKVSLADVIAQADEWARIEFSRGSKTAKVKMGYRRWIHFPTDVNETKWGSFNMALYMYGVYE